MPQERGGNPRGLMNEVNPGGNDNAIFSVEQGGFETAWVCVQNSPREEWWVMRTGGSPLYEDPSPTSGNVTMTFVFDQARNSGTTPEPFANASAFRSWVSQVKGIQPSNLSLAIHEIS